MKTTRFKTKQEFKKEFGISGARATAYGWDEKMDPLYGLPWDKTSRDESPYPDLLSEGGWGVSKSMLTTAPHPYEGRDIVIEINSEKEGVAAQKKVLALGYLWNGGYSDVRDNYGSTDLCISGGRLFRNPDTEDYETHLVLSFTQFMEGEVPKTEDQYVNEFWQDWKKTNDDRVTATRIAMMGGEGKIKPDAYIHEGELYIWSGNKEMPANVNKAWMYNLLSEEDFKKKHTPQLKFKGWEVDTSKPGSVKFGCKVISKNDLRGFHAVMKELGGHSVDPDEAYIFLRNKRKELGF